MSLNVNPTLFAQDFRANLELALQQAGSRLRPFVTVSTVSGAKQAVVVERVEQIATTPVTGQLQRKTPINATVTRRWADPLSWESTQYVDHFDKLKMLNDPMSVQVQNASNAHGRDFDAEINAAMWRAVKSGETGASTIAFDTSNMQIAANFEASGNVGLTAAKLRGALRKLKANEVDVRMDPVFCGVTAEEWDDLCKDPLFMSRDYTNDPILTEGVLGRRMGITFVEYQSFTTSGSNRLIPMWTKSAIHLKVWEDVQTNVYQDTNLVGDPWAVSSVATAGAARADEKRIVQILCA